jgi:hypothetical protein
MKSLLLTAILIFISAAAECYKPVTKTSLPTHIKTIAVPAFQFEPKGLRYRIESRFSEAVIKELMRRSRGIKIQSNREGADAVIEGTIRDFNFTGVLLDREGRARIYEITIVSAVTLIDTKENKVLFDNQNLVFRDSFDFSQDPRSFFNEEDPAVERIARAFAESLISSIINGIDVRKEKKD